MARQRKNSVGGANPSTPSQQDDEEILQELGAQPDEAGELVVDEDRIRAAGAIDTTSIIENRRMQAILDKKRGNVKGVQINVSDPLSKYDLLIKIWPASTMRISVTRTTGPATPMRVIDTPPKSSSDLYKMMQAIHGQNEEHSYDLLFRDIGGQIRGGTAITMPDTRPAQPQQGQPMNPYYPYGSPPPGYPPGYAPPGYAPQPAQPAPTAAPSMPPPASVFVQPAPPPDMGAMLTSMKQMFDMIQSVHQQAAQQQHVPLPVATPPAQPVGAVAFPPPPATPDMGAMMAWMRQMFDLIQSMQPASAPGSSPARGRAAEPAPAMNPMTLAAMMGMGMPPMQPPPGMMWIPNFGFVPLDRLVQAVGGGPAAGPGPYRGPYRPPYASGDPGAPPYQGPHGPPPRPLTPAEQFRDSITVLRSAAEAIQDLGSILPGQQAAAAAEAEADDSPIQVIDTGPAKIIVNKRDGTLRGWETGWANMDKVFKWVGEQREAIQKSHDARELAKRPQQLPPGYVEVTPGYQPPPGYVAVPVTPQQIPAAAPPPPAPQQALSPPPAQVPPPMPATAPVRPTWSMPTIPGQGGS
jgi:hypothetical protein